MQNLFEFFYRFISAGRRQLLHFRLQLLFRYAQSLFVRYRLQHKGLFGKPYRLFFYLNAIRRRIRSINKAHHLFQRHPIACCFRCQIINQYLFVVVHHSLRRFLLQTEMEELAAAGAYESVEELKKILDAERYKESMMAQKVMGMLRENAIVKEG